MQNKIKNLNEIGALLEKEREKGHVVVQCHGVFDLLHPGHIRHFQEAKKQGDTLVVSLTPDRFVNKGPGRPAFSENLRLEQLASLACVDFVVLNDSPDAVSVIEKIRPGIYVKGNEYSTPSADVTGKIVEEENAVKSVGGQIYFTQDITFSSSTLINRHFDGDQKRLEPFLAKIRAQYSVKEILEKIDALSRLKVLVVGDAIIDEYQYVTPLGQSGKGVHMTAQCLSKETFLGGSLIISGHVAAFAAEVTLLTAIGATCPYREFIHTHLHPRVKREFISIETFPTLLKKRYVMKDGQTLTKLFETYSSNDCLVDEKKTQEVIAFLKQKAQDYDLVLVCDFGNGFTNPSMIEALSQVPTFLAVNAQTNGGNRGYNVVTHYKRADFISLNEPELRLAAQDRYRSVESLAKEISLHLHAKEMSVTRGVNGVLYFGEKECVEVPALTTYAIDRIGAGDNYLALSALSAASGNPPILSAFLGSVAAAMGVQVVGNKESVDKIALAKYVTRLLK